MLNAWKNEKICLLLEEKIFVFLGPHRWCERYNVYVYMRTALTDVTIKTTVHNNTM